MRRLPLLALLLAPFTGAAEPSAAAETVEPTQAELAAVPEPSSPCHHYDGTATDSLRFAAQEGNLIRAKAALALPDTRINACNKNGVSVLAHTLYHKQASMARFLIENGARPGDELERRRLAVMLARAPAPGGGPGITKEDLAAAVAAAMKEQAAAPAAEPARPAGPRMPPVSKPVIFAADRPNDLAVIVGVESYSDIATKAPYAERDAEAFKAHVRALGVPERNIVLLTGSKASRSALVKNVEGWLPRMSKPGGRVYFYFSGHGAPDPRNGTAYLVPWDGDPNFLDATGYPVNELYKRLGELPASQVLVALDSCFSGAGGRSVLPTGARPLVSKLAPVAVPSKLTVLTASASNEISGSLDEKGHGAFTWFLLEGLNAGKRSAKELHAYLLPRVQDESRRLNRDQTPQLLGADASLR
jgi:hypothetical protein